MKLPSLLAVVICISFVAPVFAQKPELVVQTGHSSDYIWQLAFSPDSKMLASAGFFDPNMKIWHIETGKELASVNVSGSPIVSFNAFAWRQNIIHLSIGGVRSGSCIRYDVQSKKVIFSAPHQFKLNFRSASYNPDFSVLCYPSDSTAEEIQDSTITKKDSVRIVEVSTGTIKATLPVSGKTVATYSNDGKYIITNTNEKRTSLWDGGTFSFVRSLPIETDKISLEAISPDSQKLSFNVNDTTIQVFGMQENTILATMNGHKQKILTSTFSPDGKLLYSTSNDSTVKVWDVANGKLLKSFGTFPASTASITVSPNGRILAMTTMPASRVIYLLDAETGKILRVLRGGVAASLGEVGLGKQAQHIFVTRKDLMNFIDAETESAPELFHRWDFSSLAQSVSDFQKKLQKSETSLYRTVNDTMIACEYNDSLVCFWNVENGKELQRIRATAGNIICTAISQDKKLGIVVSSEGKKRAIRAYNLSTGKLQWLDSSYFISLRRGGNSFVFSPNDSIVFALRLDRTKWNATEHVLGYDRKTGKIIHNFPASMPYFLDSYRFSWGDSKDTVFNMQTSKKEIYRFDFAQGMEVLIVYNDVLLAKKQGGDTIAFHIPTKQILPSHNGFRSFSRNGKFAFESENASTQIIPI
ncbi:MAG: hypothetical protein MUF71_20865 [Candidatus Kapabacteria bacterium]|jgi:WD40 repeat protein|nr:hypothetical protein [Candidatus Kapabacteria bacterium]